MVSAWRSRLLCRSKVWQRGCPAWCVGHGYSKAVEIAAPKSFLSPCIVDDDPADLEALAALIGELGYEPVPTADPEEALKAVRYGRCRLVLADVSAPAIGGYEFLDRALRGDPGLHIIVMTRDYTLD